eukprot:6198961-Pyramimonas_sp.AAC.1
MADALCVRTLSMADPSHGRPSHGAVEKGWRRTIRPGAQPPSPLSSFLLVTPDWLLLKVYAPSPLTIGPAGSRRAGVETYGVRPPLSASGSTWTP